MLGDYTIQTILDDVDSNEDDGSIVTVVEDQFYVEEDKFQLLFLMMLMIFWAIIISYTCWINLVAF